MTPLADTDLLSLDWQRATDVWVRRFIKADVNSEEEREAAECLLIAQAMVDAQERAA